MPFVKKFEGSPHGIDTIACQRMLPKSNALKDFGVGTIYACDECGQKWKLVSFRSEQRDSYDVWEKYVGPGKQGIDSTHL